MSQVQLHLLLIYFNTVIIKGASNIGLLWGWKLTGGTARDIPKSIHMHDHDPVFLFAATP